MFLGSLEMRNAEHPDFRFCILPWRRELTILLFSEVNCSMHRVCKTHTLHDKNPSPWLRKGSSWLRVTTPPSTAGQLPPRVPLAESPLSLSVSWKSARGSAYALHAPPSRTHPGEWPESRLALQQQLTHSIRPTLERPPVPGCACPSAQRRPRLSAIQRVLRHRVCMEEKTGNCSRLATAQPPPFPCSSDGTLSSPRQDGSP